MLAYIIGKYISAGNSSLIIENNNKGYIVNTSANTINDIISMGQDEIKVYTYLNISENAIDLYGFSTEAELECFKLLIKVNGVGPKTAAGILSLLTADDLKTAVLTDNTDIIKQCSGIGLKTAQRVIIELKNKVNDIADNETVPDGRLNEYNDAIDALITLGYRPKDARLALNNIKNLKELSSAEMVKQALKLLNHQ